MFRHFMFSLLLIAFTISLRADAELKSDGYRSYQSLNGEWSVLPIEGLQFNFPPPKDGWQPAKVPSGATEALAFPGNPYGGGASDYLNEAKTDFNSKTKLAAWFNRDFLFVGAPAGKRVLLHFDGMAFRSEVWLNGKKIGGSLIGQLPITFDVTEAIQKGSNELVVGLTSREGLIDVAHRTFLAPSNGSPAGIWGDVELQIVPEIRIDDIFVKTSVADKRITLDVTVVNAGNKPRQVSVSTMIADHRQNPETQFASPEVTVNPGESKVVKLSKDWVAPELWSLENPALYYAWVSLDSGGQTLDVRTERFGFREFEVRGFDFYLNGKKIVLLRDSMLAGIPTKRKDIFDEIRWKAGSGAYNSIRMHIGFDSRALAELCDELGLICIPEGSWFTLDDKFRLDQRELWLPQAKAYTQGLIKLFRNHPSVMIWNLTNETIWEKTTPEHLEVADAILGAAREMDTTRPFMGDGECSWGGRLDGVNIHYPESSVNNSLREKFPNSGFVFPNDLYWLARNQPAKSWAAVFTWDRPLVIGEYFYPSGDTDRVSAFMGDSIYDWEKWRNQRLDARDLGVNDENEFSKAQNQIADAYRLQGVAGLNPWASDAKKVIPKVAVRPVDFFPNAFSGSVATRKFVVFNNSGRNFNSPNLQCRLTVNGETVWEKTIPVSPDKPEGQTVEIPIQCPIVTSPVEAQLSVRFREQEGVGTQLDRAMEPLFILPRPSLAGTNAGAVVLFDTNGKTAAALKSLGLNLPAAKAISAANLQKAKMLIIGEDSDASSFKDQVADFARGGGAVIVLRQEQWTPLTNELPEIDKEHVSTRSWKRSFDHPVTRDFDDRQFSYWRPDHLVSLRTFRKPSAGRYRILLDAGGLYGLRWSPLLEIPSGKGVFILSSLDLAGRIDQEPMAAQMLANLVRYAESYQPPKTAPLRLLAGKNAPLRAVLTAAGVVFTEGLKGTGPVLIDASFDPTAPQISELKTVLTGGGKLWLHGFNADSIGKVAALLPFKPEFANPDPTVLTAKVQTPDPLLNNLASFDFAWARVEMETFRDYFEKANATAKLGATVLKLPALQSGQRLLNPGFLVKVPSGKGMILFDTLQWPEALGGESEKVTRIAGSLAANLGAEIRPTAEEASYALFSIDLSKQANMGYYDAEADDGKGGWTDQGKNDMRFFLINHLGKAGGLESNLDVEKQDFPSEVSLAGRKFWLLDPRKTQDHAVISLRGKDHGAKLPASAEGIPVNRKADALWFLAGAGWSAPEPDQEVARYVIHYQDGTQTVFPIRYGQEIAEWWNPRPMPKAKVAWTGGNLATSPIGIYAIEWKNPQPDKEIASIDVVGDLSPVQFVTVAITGGVQEGGAPKTTTLGQWNLGSFANNTVPNQIQGKGALRANPETAPTLASGGLHFQDGQKLIGSLKTQLDWGGLGKGLPFAVRMTVTPEAAPTGYCAGLFEAMRYQEAGFRLVLNQTMKLGMEAFTEAGPRHLTSPGPLEVGRTYQIELKFDGTYATLLVDGRVEAMEEMPLPTTFSEDFVIGVTAGNQYYFKGVITEVALLGLPKAP